MEFISIVPNIKTSLELDPEIIKIISSTDDHISRIIIQDNNGYGVCLPAVINQEENVVEFILPEQLCVFIASETYLCKFECILENQILVPFILEANIDLKDDCDDETRGVDQVQGSDIGSTPEPIRPVAGDEAGDDMDSILDAIAPRSEEKHKKTPVEDIIKNLDEEFVKQALWAKQQTQQVQQNTQSGFVPPEPVSSKRVLLKNQMKNILLDMLK